MRQKKNRIIIITGMLLLLAAVMIFLLIKQGRRGGNEAYSDEQVAVAEIKAELGFGIYAEENWEEFFSVSHKEYLTNSMLKQLLEYLRLDTYVKTPGVLGRSLVTREEWNTVYEQILDYLDMEEEVQQKEILVLDTMKAEAGNIVITNEGDYYTTLPMSYFEKWNAYHIYGKENQCLGISSLAEEESTVSNVYLKNSSKKNIVFLYSGAEYEKEIDKTDAAIEAGVCDLVFQKGSLKTVRTKQDKIQGNLLSYDENTIEIEGYGKISHLGKLPVYQTYGEVEETSISHVVLGNMQVEYVTGENQVCAILITQPANIEDIRVLLLAEDGSKFRTDIYLKTTTQASLKCGVREESIEAGTVLHPADYIAADETFILTPDTGEGQVIVCDGEGTVLTNGYYGSMEVRRYEEGYTLVNQLPFETYLCAVVPSEMPSSYAREALRAQAVCARSYAYIQLLRADLARYGAHINDSTSYQVYNKTAPTEQSRAAVYDTAGRVLTYEGDTIEAYYFSTSVGYTDTAEVWNAESTGKYGYLKSVSLLETPCAGNLADEAAFLDYITKPATGYDSDIKFFRWTAVADYSDKTAEINQILEGRKAVVPGNILYYEKDGKTETESLSGMGELQAVSVAERSSAGSILTLKLQYKSGIVLVKTEYNIRKVLGCGLKKITYQDGSENESVTMLPSASCAVTTQPDKTVLLQGGGYGHGLGMSQNAANGMAKAGMSYEDILQYFYNNIKIEEMTK